MATLTITATHNYSGEFLGLPNIDQLLFQTTDATIATFASNQFGGGPLLISNSVQIVGDANANLVFVDLASGATAFSAAGWQFSGWSPVDDVHLNGTDSSDVITGSTERNFIVGGGGADALTGGAQSDRFGYIASSDAVAGETVDGGDGTDAITVDNGLYINFRDVTFSSIEEVHFSSQTSAVTTAFLTSNQIGAGAITSVIGDVGTDQLSIVAVSNVDLSSMTFTSWNNGGNDQVYINGTPSGENLTGSSQNDNILGNGGADVIVGGAGDDTISFHAGIVRSLSIDGGTGTDRLLLINDGSFDFTDGVTFSALEHVNFLGTLSQTAIFRGTQVGPGAITQVNGRSGIDNLVVNAASDVNLSGLIFTGWINGTDTVSINGTASGENLTGSSQNDTINGGGGGDFLDGGAGGDALDGGAGFDLASWLSQTSGLTLNLGNQGLNAGAAAGDTVTNVEAIYLTNAADSFTAGAAGLFVYGFGDNDTLTGSSQSDFFDGGAGGDTINAGGGFDYVSYNSSTAAVTLNLQTPASNTGHAAGDAISNADAYILTEFGDTFIGLTSGQNIVFGYGGDDTLVGGLDTNNWFFGGEGDDRMVGGRWADLYVGGNGADTIVPVTGTPIAGSSVFGFTPGTDTIEISRSAFGLSAGYAVTAGTTFAAGTSPTNTVVSPTFLYYTNSGLLYFDPDGTGAIAATLLMQMAGASALAASDFHLV
jgi:Ca2+-binding RTX toxin-like protein